MITIDGGTGTISHNGTSFNSGNIIQVVSRTVGHFDLASGTTNAAFSGTPETIIDGCQKEIQITKLGSKIFATIGGFAVLPERAGPGEFAGTIGHASNGSSGASLSASDYSYSFGELCSGRKNWSSDGLNNSYEGASAGPIYMAQLHTHGLAVGQYAYYTAAFKDDYGGANNGKYFVKGYGTITLMEIE
tara:strand:- start:974 stop:1540 length:567 start_codon:yes stop_codon:yes gene_type:complete